MKKEFTLAEVLITLGVVDVVVTLTIPTVINKYKGIVTVNKVKKFYSVISQAFQLSVKDNGSANEWNVGNEHTRPNTILLTNYLKSYLKVIKDCGTSSGCLEYKNKTKLLNGNSNYNYDTSSYYYKMIFNDESYLWIRSALSKYCQTFDGGSADSCGIIFFDINGKKEPNTVGKDIFSFVITPFAIKPSIQYTCNKNANGWGCSGYILKNGNMNYLK